MISDSAPLHTSYMTYQAASRPVDPVAMEDRIMIGGTVWRKGTTLSQYYAENHIPISAPLPTYQPTPIQTPIQTPPVALVAPAQPVLTDVMLRTQNQSVGDLTGQSLIDSTYDPYAYTGEVAEPSVQAGILSGNNWLLILGIGGILAAMYFSKKGH